MALATLPKPPSYLQKLSAYQIAQHAARRGQRKLDQMLRQRLIVPREVSRLAEEVEELWVRVDRAGSAFAREKGAAPRKVGVA